MESYESTTRRMKSDKPGLCALIQDMLPFYLEGDISPQSRQFVESHLEECERCASFLAGGQSVQAHFRRESATRADILDRDRPAQHLIASGQRRVIGTVLAVAGGLVFLMVACGLLFGFARSSVSFPNDFGQSYEPTVVPPMAEGVIAPAYLTPTPFSPTAVAPNVEPATDAWSQPTSTPLTLQPTVVPSP